MIMNQNFVLAMKGPALQPGQSLDGRSLGDIQGLLRRVLDESRAVLQGLRTPNFAPASIEKELPAF